MIPGKTCRTHNWKLFETVIRGQTALAVWECSRCGRRWINAHTFRKPSKGLKLDA